MKMYVRESEKERRREERERERERLESGERGPGELFSSMQIPERPHKFHLSDALQMKLWA